MLRFFSTSSRLALAFGLLVTSLLLGGCGQDLGERCEQPSDCKSGYCGDTSGSLGMTSAMGMTCTSGPTTTGGDAATPNDDGSGGGDRATASEGGHDVATADAADAADVGSDRPASEAGVEAGDASTPDGASADHAADGIDGSAADADGAVDLALDVSSAG